MWWQKDILLSWRLDSFGGLVKQNKIILTSKDKWGTTSHIWKRRVSCTVWLSVTLWLVEKTRGARDDLVAAHFVLCASPLMGQDHNMSSNLAGKGPKRTLCVLRNPGGCPRPATNWHDHMPEWKRRAVCQQASLCARHREAGEALHIANIHLSMLHMLAGLSKPLAPLGCQYHNHLIEGPVNI